MNPKSRKSLNEIQNSAVGIVTTFTALLYCSGKLFFGAESCFCCNKTWQSFAKQYPRQTATLSGRHVNKVPSFSIPPQYVRPGSLAWPFDRKPFAKQTPPFCRQGLLDVYLNLCVFKLQIVYKLDTKKGDFDNFAMVYSCLFVVAQIGFAIIIFALIFKSRKAVLITLFYLRTFTVKYQSLY